MPSLKRRLIGFLGCALVGSIAIGCPSSPPPAAEPTTTKAPLSPLPRFCDLVQQALGDRKHFRCLPVPNFQVTGYFGTLANPERSEFRSACFMDDENAAARLRVEVRPAAGFRAKLRTELHSTVSGKLNLGFLGPWAPTLRASSGKTERFELELELKDAEIRVLSSVGDVLFQEFDEAPEDSPLGRSLGECLRGLCDSKLDLVYTAKVLAAVPEIRIRRGQSQETKFGLKLLAGEFEKIDQQGKSDELIVRAKHKLNVAVVTEKAAPVVSTAGACRALHNRTKRKQIAGELSEISAFIVVGKKQENAQDRILKLRKLIRSADLPPEEENQLLSAAAILTGASSELSKSKPGRRICKLKQLGEDVLGAKQTSTPLASALVAALGPLQRQLGEVSNQHDLPCADPKWFRDNDRDGYGDKKHSRRSNVQPPGYVANALDCYDENPEAYPGQRLFFPQHRGDRSFDFDCDGKSTRRDSVLSEGCRSSTILGIPTECWADVGWWKQVPRCGEQGRWLHRCETNTLACRASEEPRRLQHCR